jgi:uncharacterized protein
MLGPHDPRRSRSPDIPAAPTGIALFVATTPGGPASPAVLTSLADHLALFGDGDDAAANAIRDYFTNGGQRALVAPLAAPERQPNEAARYLTAIRSIGGGTPFDLVCLPIEPGVELEKATLVAVLDECVARRAMLLLDAAASWAADPVTALTAVTRGISALRAQLNEQSLANAAIYFPRFLAAGRNGSPSRLGSPASAVAGIISRVDRARGVWSAPAGVQATVAGATGLQMSPTDAESTALNLSGVNVLRHFHDRGIVVWGARTMADTVAAEPAFRYVTVRRLALFIERSLEAGLEYATFEPNDEPLWQRIRTDVSHFAHRLFANGGFQGRTDNEAYFVHCGRDTMTEDDIRQGRLNVEVGFAPLKPAEFVVLRIGKHVGSRNSS